MALASGGLALFMQVPTAKPLVALTSLSLALRLHIDINLYVDDTFEVQRRRMLEAYTYTDRMQSSNARALPSRLARLTSSRRGKAAVVPASKTQRVTGFVSMFTPYNIESGFWSVTRTTYICWLGPGLICSVGTAMVRRNS